VAKPQIRHQTGEATKRLSRGPWVGPQGRLRATLVDGTTGRRNPDGMPRQVRDSEGGTSCCPRGGDEHRLGWRLEIAAGPLAALCSVVGPALVIRGALRWFKLCFFGECSTADEGPFGLGFLVLGVVATLGGAVLAAWWSGRRALGWRAALALPAALVVGVALHGSGLTKIAPYGENVTLYGMAMAGMGLVVPPRTPWWVAGAIGGAGVASLFGDVPLPGVLLGVLTLGITSSAEAYAERRWPRVAPRCRAVWPVRGP
jgi:hypothetical protein